MDINLNCLMPRDLKKKLIMYSKYIDYVIIQSKATDDTFLCSFKRHAFEISLKNNFCQLKVCK